MNIAPHKKHAASSDSFCVGPCVRSLAMGCILGGVVCCAMAAPPEPPAGRNDIPSNQPRDRDRYIETRAPQRVPDGRDEPRRAPQGPDHADGNHRGSHMTPDERRDLRRQINEAGQDIYALPPRR